MDVALFNIPFLDGYKSLISGWGLLIIGIAGLLMAIGHCLTGDLTLLSCYATVQQSIPPVTAALAGLGILGIGHKQEKIRAAITDGSVTPTE